MNTELEQLDSERYSHGEPTGPLVVMLAGLGAVSTTLVAGVDAIARLSAPPTGSLALNQTIRIGSRGLHTNREPLIRELLPLADPATIQFQAWDPLEGSGLARARQAEVLSEKDIGNHWEMLDCVAPEPAVFSPYWVPRLAARATRVKVPRDGEAAVCAIEKDISNWLKAAGLGARGVVVYAGSTEITAPWGEWKDARNELTAGGRRWNRRSAFQQLLEDPEADIPPSVLYAEAAVRAGVPFINGSPSDGCTPYAVESAAVGRAPIAGRDFKTGQTLLKTVLAPAFKARQLGVRGWFSTNILGNLDGEVLDEPAAFESKRATKSGVLDTILQPELYPELYGDLTHMVRINHYPPRGDQKEGWDNIDLFGWMGYPMQLKVDFLCRDSILAAPVLLDLILFMDLAARRGMTGVQDWLSFYFKAPQTPAGQPRAEHDLFIQHLKLKNMLRAMAGEDPLDHLEELRE